MGEAKGPFTVFAPTNDAFGKLPKAELDRLLEPKNVKELANILTYHVVSGAAVYSKDLKPTQEVATLQGQNLIITSSAAGVVINGNSKVTTADNAASNGVVHIIDTVLIPKAATTTTESVAAVQDAASLPHNTSWLLSLALIFAILN